MKDVQRLPAAEVDAAIDVLCESFYDYPVMRRVLGARDDYDRAIRTLLGFFVTARVLRDEPLLGFRREDGELAGVAMMTLPGTQVAPSALTGKRETVWAELGDGARRRYEAYGATTSRFEIAEPHSHLNMIGVRRAHQGRGLARSLLEAVHALSRERDDSTGVTLTTEHAPNVGLYEHFGYRVVGHGEIAPGLESWVMFRPDEA